MLSTNQKEIIKLAIPIIIGQISQMLVSITDAIMVGRLGYVQLAAASLMISICSVPSFSCLGLSYLISSLVAEKRGQAKNSECGEVLFNATAATLLISLMIALTFTLCFPLIHSFGQEEQVITAGKNFFLWIIWSLVPMAGYMCIKQFYDGLEMTKIPMVISTASVALNLFLNFVFIYGLLGINAYGLEGSGIASFITRILMLGIMVIHLFTNKALRAYGILKIKLSLKKMSQFLKIALPSSWQFTSEVAAFAALAILAGWYGAIPQAAHQVSITIAAFTYVIYVGLASASSIKIAESFGKKNYQEIHTHGKDSIKIAITLSISMALLFTLFRIPLALLFNTNPEVVDIASKLLIMAAIFQISDSLQALGIGMLRGLQDVRIPTLYTTIAYWIIGIPVGYMLAEWFHLKVFGIWIGFILCLSASASLLMFRFKKIVKKNILDL